MRPFAVALAISLAPFAAAASIVNGAAETGDMTGWEDIVGPVGAVQQASQTAGTVFPFQGSYFFRMTAAAASTASFTQRGDTLLFGDWLSLTGYVQTEFEDEAEVALRILDAGDDVLDAAYAQALNTPNLTWRPFTVGLQVPAGAASWEIELSGTRVTGTFVNVFWDDMVLFAPEPGPGVAAGVAFAVLFSLRKRTVA